MALRLASRLLLLTLAVGALWAQDPPPDNRIYDEVRQVLAFDADVRGAAIEVVVKDGAVVLRGRVRTDKAREKATKLTKKVKGVTSVDNKLRLFGEK